jgi:hypothetical protein
MAAYGAITLYVVAEQQDNTIVRPEWEFGEDENISRTRIPYANATYTQQVGRSNGILTLKCEVFSDADFVTLRTMRGDNTPRTLVNPFGDGVDYNGVLLQKIKDAKRVTFEPDWTFTAEFEYTS